jgi:hypothetical protein
VALATLDALQATGRQVGIISHVSGLAERIGVQVRVVKQGGGRSRLVVQAEGGLMLLPEPPASGSGGRWREAYPARLARYRSSVSAKLGSSLRNASPTPPL